MASTTPTSSVPPAKSATDILHTALAHHRPQSPILVPPNGPAHCRLPIASPTSKGSISVIMADMCKRRAGGAGALDVVLCECDRPAHSETGRARHQLRHGDGVFGVAAECQGS
jgi:hypothetical protein